MHFRFILYLFTTFQDDFPEYVQNMYANAHKDIKGVRARQSEIVNNIFDDLGNGKLAVNLAKPLFQEGLKHYNKDYAKKTNNAVPRILKANEFPDGDAGVARAIAAQSATNRLHENERGLCNI